MDQGFRNFCGVWILHYPVRTSLCQDGESYYVTDLAKGAMLTNEEGSGNEKKYDEWYPLLEKELGLVAKPDAKIISIGNRVGQLPFQKGTVWSRWDDSPLLQVEPRAIGGRKSEGRKRESEYKQFAALESHNLRCSCSPNRGCERDREPVKATPTEQQTRLMFDYKVRFDRIREQGRSGWRHWQREWERRITSA